MNLETALNYFCNILGLPDNAQDLYTAITESPDKDQIISQVIRFYCTAVLTSNYKLETGEEAVNYRSRSGDYQAASAREKYNIDSIINTVFNQFDQALQQIYADVDSLLSPFYGYEPGEQTKVYELREEQLRQLARDHISYMNPNNPHHGISFTSSDSDKENKLYNRIAGIINKANGIGLDESNDPEGIREIHRNWVDSLYNILDSESEFQGDDLLEWFITTGIFDNSELYRHN